MILDLGLKDYEEAYSVQREFVKRRIAGEIEDSLIIAEHPAVFTIGRLGRIEENLLVDERFLRSRQIKVLNVDRGGDITFHGPGQLVLYPILDLRDRARDIHRYLRELEEAAINFLRRFSVSGERSSGKTGVWVGSKKIAFVGIAASNWVTYHGMSINIDVELDFFSMIHPCGLKGAAVTGLSEILNRRLRSADVKTEIISNFENIFGIINERVEWEPAGVA